MTMALKTETSDHLQDMLLNGDRRRRKKKKKEEEERRKKAMLSLLLFTTRVFQVDSFNKNANTHTQFFFKVS